jgi:hypothetical protein
MIAGMLALLLVSADTTMRFPAIDLDSLPVPVATSIAPIEPVLVTTQAGDSLAPVSDPALGLRLVLARPDTAVKKKRAALVEYSDWYGRRLAIHKVLSWTMIPLFAASYYTGERLARDGRANSPYAVRAIHPWAATGAAAVFGVNTVTGVWNLWASRKDPEGRTRRWIHSALFIVADAGFAYAGSIGREGRENGEIRDRHRTIALSSMGVSTLGWLIMLIGQ